METKKISFWGGLAWPLKVIAIIIPISGAVWFASSLGLIPGMTSAKSTKVAEATNISHDEINVVTAAKSLPVPNIDDSEYANVTGRPQINMMNWIWFANIGIPCANGGLKTMKGSLMDKYGLNVRIITNNSVDDMKREQLLFINKFAKGEKQPTEGVGLTTMMGDGATNYIPTVNKLIVKTCGEEFKLKVIGISGFSVGEDCTVGPIEWFNNHQLMKGALIAAVIGDGDHLLNVRFASGDNRMNINPDPATYDANAVNFVPATDGNFLLAVQQIGQTVMLKEKNSKGELTGKIIPVIIQGAATWFPGDRQAFKKFNVVKVVSTIQYPNQMACVIVGCDKWMKDNRDMVVKFLSATLTATNQIKQNDGWYRYASKIAVNVFNTNASDASETAEDWYKFSKPGGGTMQNVAGVTVSAGGSQMANLADNLKYFGIKGGNNYYKSVFEYFNGVLMELNPCDFKGNVGEVTPYNEVTDLSYLQAVNIDQGQTTKANYADNKGVVVGKRSWNIVFDSGKATITPEGEAELRVLFNLVNTASENSRLEIVGYTDNTGNSDQNLVLSLLRAKAVKQKLIDFSNHTFTSEKFSTDGEGDKDPIASNDSEAGRKQNRRVVITLME